MATRFGGASPSRAFQVQTTWVIGGLIVLVVILLGALYFLLAQDTSVASENVTAEKVVAPQETPSAVRVLVAMKRIEAGSALEAYMFEGQDWDPSQVPAGAVLEKDASLLEKKFAASLINPHMPLVREAIADSPPASAIPIPPGYRAITISVDAQTGVEGLVQPGKRVDVLCQITDKSGLPKVGTVVRFAKVLSVAGITTTGGDRVPIAGQTTATLLVTEEDAKKIALASSIGKLSLTLIGEDTPLLDAQKKSSVIDYKAIFGDDPAVTETSREGVAYYTDDQGHQVRYDLRNGAWNQHDSE